MNKNVHSSTVHEDTKNGKQSKYASVVKWIIKLWSIHIVEYYRVAKLSELQLHISMDDKSQKHVEQKANHASLHMYTIYVNCKIRQYETIYCLGHTYMTHQLIKARDG